MLGVWVKLGTPDVLEIIAGSGVDFVVIDGEHGAYDRTRMSAMVGVARALGLTVYVRTLGHASADISPALDAGADGVFIPHVDDVPIAQRVVAACRFPPRGTRPASLTTRAGDWGRRPLAEYLAKEPRVILQIESPEAVDNAHDISRVPGVDGLFVGPFDLAISAGVAGGSAELEEIIRRVENMQSPVDLGGVAADVREARAMSERGYAFLMIGADVSLLAGMFRTLADRTREALLEEETT
jgi:2-keto-3-deoxy-L-rhamnonate aldolase RhmA